MGTNTPLNCVLMTALGISTAVVPISYESYGIQLPSGDFKVSHEISDWTNTYVWNVPSATSDLQNYHTLVAIAESLIDSSTDIDQEFVDIVNENFWDLL